MPATIFDRYGRRIADRIVPDGGRVSVPLPFRDARAVHTQRAFMHDAEPRVMHRPGFVQSVIGDGFAATTSNQRSQSASEAARQDYINRISNQWRQTWQAMPQGAHKPKPGLASYDPDDAADSDDPSERAYQRMEARLADAWRNTDDNAEGVAVMSEDLPDDIQQLPLVQQQGYCAAYNKHMEENPDADDADCDAAGRKTIAALGQDSSVFEAIRTDAQRRYCERVANAWRTR
jgi:hypothetical protein